MGRWRREDSLGQCRPSSHIAVHIEVRSRGRGLLVYMTGTFVYNHYSSR